MAGWVKLHRKTLESSVFDNPGLLKTWVWCLLKATHKDRKQLVGLQEVELKQGQFVFGRKMAANELGFAESKAYRYIQTLEELGNILIEPSSRFSIVTIVKWEVYQEGVCDNKEQEIISKEFQEVEKPKEVKKKENNTEKYKAIVEHLNRKTGKEYRYNTKQTTKLINARLDEGFKVKDFITVIDKKVPDWSNSKWEKFLRPSTLFNSRNFEGYLNEKGANNNDGGYKPDSKKFTNDYYSEQR